MLETMELVEDYIEIPAFKETPNKLQHMLEHIQGAIAKEDIPVRVAVTETTSSKLKCEIGLVRNGGKSFPHKKNTVFNFRQRKLQSCEKFNVVLLVPTGVGAEIGGHAGDATPIARLIAQSCDNLITHPNVVNASDLCEMTQNTLYVEGSLISRLLMGDVALLKTNSNRVRVLVDGHRERRIFELAINAINAAKATYGVRFEGIEEINPPSELQIVFASSGRATGKIGNFENLLRIAAPSKSFDAIALSTVIRPPQGKDQCEFFSHYFSNGGVNPWGGVEALLTHGLSTLLDIPTAHSPMLESLQILNTDLGIVDPRMAAESISITYLQCIFKGLRQAPKVLTDPSTFYHPSAIASEDVSCLIIPEGCLGLPTLAALEQNIPVIAVKNNKNLMKNDLASLGWGSGQYYEVENYLEAAGLVTAMRAGLDPASLSRPVEFVKFNNQNNL